MFWKTQEYINFVSAIQIWHNFLSCLTGGRIRLKRILYCPQSYHYLDFSFQETNEPHHEKTNVLVSDLVRHKIGCTATQDGKRLEISDLGSKGIVLSV